jgi:hypothetical protein
MKPILSDLEPIGNWLRAGSLVVHATSAGKKMQLNAVQIPWLKPSSLPDPVQMRTVEAEYILELAPICAARRPLTIPAICALDLNRADTGMNAPVTACQALHLGGERSSIERRSGVMLA